MSWPGTTDQQRSLFLKGFKLSDQGKFEDPTYLGFKIVIDFGTLPVDPEFGQPPSPLFKTGNYEFNGGMGSISNPFGQEAYLLKGGPVQFYSAQGYLRAREGADDDPNQWPDRNAGKRSFILAQFKQSFRDLLDNHPWFLQSIQGLDKLYTISRGGYTDESEVTFNPSRTAGKTLTFSCLESFNQRMGALGEMYKQSTFDPDYMRELVPRNLKRFKMYIFVSEIRNFFKTSRLIGSSTALTAVNNLANLLGGASNSGRDSVSTVAEQFNSAAPPQPDPGSSSSFGSIVGSFARNVADNSGLQDEIDYFTGQADQSDIKPVLIFECSNCEFDFDDSTSLPSDLSAGADTATPISYSFKIHVGRVRTKYQFPNIRSDKKPLVLADGWDQNRTSVATDIVPDELSGSPFVQNLLDQGEQLLTNFVSNSINDFINEGIAQFVDPLLNGLDQGVLGNIYSFDPSALLTQASFNNAQNFFDSVTSNGVNPGNILSGDFPNPQTMGLGGPKERTDLGKYRSPADAGPKDAYSNVPGPNLGVAPPGGEIEGRIYPPPPVDDFYPNAPGLDLGPPGRIYNDPSGDSYSGVPGEDLGGPDRIYPEPSGDFYSGVPGEDLGGPNRIYNEPDGDLYENTPGPDLGVPDRLYTAPEGDLYDGVPGPDLGGSARVYSGPEDDLYEGVPGENLGGEERVYPEPSGDAYSNVPGSDLGGSGRVYAGPEGDAYEEVPGPDLGGSQRVYSNPEGDAYSKVPGSDLGGQDRVYAGPDGDVYTSVPGKDLGVSERVYENPSGDVYPRTPGPDLGGPERGYGKPEGDVYPTNPSNSAGSTETNLGDVYKEVPGEELGVPARVYPDFRADEYDSVPGPDLGGRYRTYPIPDGDPDVYDQVPGRDLGSPDRVYAPSEGDSYEDVPGKNLGVPQREYLSPKGDVYESVPGSDLGGDRRIYLKPDGDVYPEGSENESVTPPYIDDVYNLVPFMEETGNPSQIMDSTPRVYPVDFESELPVLDFNVPGVYPEQDSSPIQTGNISSRVYNDEDPNNQLGSREILYPVRNNLPGAIEPNPLDGIPSIYPSGNRPTIRGDIGKVYPKTAEDFVMEQNMKEPSLDLGNIKHEDRYNQSLGDFNPPEEDFIE